MAQGPGMPHRLVRVLLDYTQCDAKPYLGGFRNKRTGAVYHHGATQTPRAPKYSEADRKLSRETQTVKIKQHSQQTVREQATQMARPGVLLDNDYDKEVTPGRYQTADERDEIVLRSTLRIQRWVRGWLGRKRAAYLRGKKMEREAFLRDQEARAQSEAEEHRRREIQRRMHPRTAADFEVLYNELEAWRLQETRKIKEAGLAKEQEQQVLQQLLHKETKLLQVSVRAHKCVCVCRMGGHNGGRGMPFGRVRTALAKLNNLPRLKPIPPTFMLLHAHPHLPADHRPAENQRQSGE